MGAALSALGRVGSKFAPKVLSKAGSLFGKTAMKEGTEAAASTVGKNALRSGVGALGKEAAEHAGKSGLLAKAGKLVMPTAVGAGSNLFMNHMQQKDIDANTERLEMMGAGGQMVQPGGVMQAAAATGMQPMGAQMVGGMQPMMMQQPMMAMAPMGAMPMMGANGQMVPQGTVQQAQGSVQQATPTQAAAQAAGKPDKGFRDPGSFFDAVKVGIGTGITGAIAGFMRSDGETFLGKFVDGAKGFVAGGGAGYFGKQAYDSIQDEGGTTSAVLNQGAASLFASKLTDKGPGGFSAMMQGMAAGGAANFAHDQITERAGAKGDAMADAAAGAMQGGQLGHSALGGLQGSGLGALIAGAGAGLGGLRAEKSATEQINDTVQQAGMSEKQDSDIQLGG